MKRLVQLTSSDIPMIREMLLDQQEGLCPVCYEPVKRPSLDHQHTKRIKGSGLVRGVLCANCNVFVGKVENNCKRYGIPLEALPSVLRNIAKYLEAPHTNYIHPTEKGKVKR